VLDSVLVGIVTADERGHISWLNRSARRMFGGDLGDFMGQPLHTVATDEADHPFRRTVPLFGELRDGEALQFECRVQARDARTFWVVGNAVATLGLQGGREMTFALMDIDQRRQAEARIAEAQASLQRIIEAAPMAITVCDAATLRVLQLNRAAAALYGMPVSEAVGRSLVLLHPQPVGASLQSDTDEALAHPQVVTPREYRLVRGGRTEVWDARFLPLARSEERIDQLLMVSTDVTTQREAQRAELEAAIARREMLVQEVHHRIKNNLQGVAGLMQQAVVRYPQVQPIIAEVVGQVQAIAQVYGLQVGNTGLLAVRDVIEAIAQSVQRTFGRAITLEVEGDPGWRWLLPEAESIPIALALNELFTNAIKHSPASSGVVCRLWLQADAVRVEICNRGRLPADFRLDRRPATVSGLGLVSALLPRRSASLALTQQDDMVVAALRLAPPVVRCGERATP
jgi:PAS domain S-box-containing protein